ncbi:hypothetical protein V2J09_017307 [Rumex salicifolius]
MSSAENRSSAIVPELVLSYKFPLSTRTYNERDVAVYALGVGTCGKDPVDASELKYVYHEDGQKFIKVLPTFSALYILDVLPILTEVPGLEYDPRLLLHGQQYIEIYKPLPSSTSIENRTSIAGLHDKELIEEHLVTDSSTIILSGKAAVLEVETQSFDKGSGQPLCMNRTTLFLRGAGGFSKTSHPYSYTNYPKNQVPTVRIPKSPPFVFFEDSTLPSQACTYYINALLYRLSGDYNPLHSDPILATVAGFTRPILHGLCTLGFAVRAVIRCICKGDQDMIKSISGRFLLHVYPGETLITEMWIEGLRVLYQVKVKERNRAVLSGHVDVTRLPSQL